MGYHIESVLNQIKGWRNPEFIEYAVHHIATITLIAISYFFQYTNIGVVVFFLHDVSDIVTPMMKAVVDLPFKIKYALYPVQLV